ncbi:HEAT repeat [Carpediemonas membranifera]|uniref:HEAT repeat n=1 Tax=Carpediemonas membranifera TaxID=201153 RepID=A0A8J6AWL2_9EUKA|nr:HEAT repeat [Carpediemonas membranifera]|eukprot:KAG9394310.1 HEAT repeat [Carpediemonas membranifera]
MWDLLDGSQSLSVITNKLLPQIDNILNDDQNIPQYIALRIETLNNLPTLARILHENHGTAGYRTIVKRVLPVAAQPFLSVDRNVVNNAIHAIVRICPFLEHADLLRYMLCSVIPRAVEAGLSTSSDAPLAGKLNDQAMQSLAVAGLSLSAYLAPLLSPDEVYRYSFLLIKKVIQDMPQVCFDIKRVGVACLASVTPFLSQHMVDTEVMATFNTLTHDPQWLIRRIAIAALPTIAQAVSDDVVQDLASSFLALCGDDSEWVRKSTLIATPPFLRAFLPDQEYHDSSAVLGGTPRRSRVGLTSALTPPDIFVDIVSVLPWGKTHLIYDQSGVVVDVLPPPQPDDELDTLSHSPPPDSDASLTDYDSDTDSEYDETDLYLLTPRNNDGEATDNNCYPGHRAPACTKAAMDPELTLVSGEAAWLILQLFGPSAWPKLQPMVTAIAHHPTNWAVRIGVARHLHELATLLMDQTGPAYWWNLFELFITDVDELRQTTLTHAVAFFRAFKPGASVAGFPVHTLIPQVLSAVISDGDAWRCRTAAIRIVTDLCGVFPDLTDSLDMASTLVAACEDPIFSVRQAAAETIAQLAPQTGEPQIILQYDMLIQSLLRGGAADFYTGLEVLRAMDWDHEAFSRYAEMVYDRCMDADVGIRVKVAGFVGFVLERGGAVADEVTEGLRAEGSASIRRFLG